VKRGAAILACVFLFAACGGDKATSTTVRVAGVPTRQATEACLLFIRARIVGGGTHTTCLRKIDGFPDPGATIRSRGSMAFVLPDGTIRTRVSITQQSRGTECTPIRRFAARSWAVRAFTGKLAARSVVPERSSTAR
jgi:hypothetical protein